MEFDDWDLSVEEMDSLEREALQRINQPRSSTEIRNQQEQQTHHVSSSVPASTSASASEPPSASASTSFTIKAHSVSEENRGLPTSWSSKPSTELECSKENGPKISVKFILHSSGCIAAKFPYNSVIVAAFRKIPQATWNAKERLWIFPSSSLQSAEHVLDQLPNIKVEVENLDPLVQRAMTSASRVPDLQERYAHIPDDVESKLLPFQRDGVRFILQHGGRALLADEMGLGKTLQAIAVATCIREAWPVLILSPSSLRLHWATMIQQWLQIPPSDIVVVLPQAGRSNRSGFTIVSSSSKSSIHLDGLFNIISYDIVPKLEKVLMASDFKVLIADESHYLKNAQAKRTASSLPFIKKAQYAILLSGTPALSRPIELFKQLEALYPDVYRNVHEYGNRYCKGGFFGAYQGASNHEELHNLLKATVLIRRLKKDVLLELPKKRRQQVFLDLSDKDMKQINALFRELEVIKAKIKGAKSEEEVQSLKFSEKQLINKIYTDSADAKIPAVLDYLGTMVEAGCKFLIFAHHKSMIDAIHQFLVKKKVGCIRIDGNTNPSSRQALVTDFQENDGIKAAVLSIRAAGVGLTLTAASTVVFAELSWTPGDLIQAEDRAHRIGQVSSVNIYYLLANDTVDDIIWDVVQSKLENLGQMLDGQENTLEISSDNRSRVPAESRPTNSPAKQKTLDTFLKRCSHSDDTEDESRLKYPRH